MTSTSKPQARETTFAEATTVSPIANKQNEFTANIPWDWSGEAYVATIAMWCLSKTNNIQEEHMADISRLSSFPLQGLISTRRMAMTLSRTQSHHIYSSSIR